MRRRFPSSLLTLSVIVLAVGCAAGPERGQTGWGATLGSTIEADPGCRRVTTLAGSEVRCDTAKEMDEAARREAVIDAGVACRDPFVTRDGCRARVDERRSGDGTRSDGTALR